MRSFCSISYRTPAVTVSSVPFVASDCEKKKEELIKVTNLIKLLHASYLLHLSGCENLIDVLVTFCRD